LPAHGVIERAGQDGVDVPNGAWFQTGRLAAEEATRLEQLGVKTVEHASIELLQANATEPRNYVQSHVARV
jgi:hypothetical protein